MGVLYQQKAIIRLADIVTIRHPELPTARLAAI